MAARTFAATTIPLSPMGVPEQATFAQLCPGVPFTKVVTLKLISGVTSDTSATSVDPEPM